MAYGSQDDTLVATYDGDTYVWRPDSDDIDLSVDIGENEFTEKMDSPLIPISPEMDIYSSRVEQYRGGTEDALWMNPEGAAAYVPEGSAAQLNQSIPLRVKYRGGETTALLEFEHDLLDENSPDVVLGSYDENLELAELVDEDVTLDLQENMFKKIIEEPMA